MEAKKANKNTTIALWKRDINCRIDEEKVGQVGSSSINHTDIVTRIISKSGTFNYFSGLFFEVLVVTIRRRLHTCDLFWELMQLRKDSIKCILEDWNWIAFWDWCTWDMKNCMFVSYVNTILIRKVIGCTYHASAPVFSKQRVNFLNK